MRPISEEEDEDDPGKKSACKRVWPKRAQDEQRKKIGLLEAELSLLVGKRDAGTAVDGIQAQIKTLFGKLKEEKLELQKKEKGAERGKKYRRNGEKYEENRYSVPRCVKTLKGSRQRGTPAD